MGLHRLSKIHAGAEGGPQGLHLLYVQQSAVPGFYPGLMTASPEAYPASGGAFDHWKERRCLRSLAFS
ncbi:hypothetical protein MPL1032_130227 [Mesorhizobium plurifarium]|uniref:Uncharacterized protein n=1 Tax=Mesorhizobium plurifarium TaxID=69974 RepID=A0A0K2VRD4_MESPL|nr:hypothetical protein MPL1032_130227 [Mesorhizobium plurifarium]